MNKFISSTCSYKNKQSSLALRPYQIYAYEDNGKLDTYYCGGVFPDKDKEQFDNELKKINELSK